MFQSQVVKLIVVYSQEADPRKSTKFIRDIHFMLNALVNTSSAKTHKNIPRFQEGWFSILNVGVLIIVLYVFLLTQ